MQAPPVPRDTVAFVGVDVVPMDSERLLRDHTVMVEGGVITTMSPRAEVDTIDAHVVDGRGRYLLPGLADMHVHLWNFTTAPLYPAHGVTTVRNMWGDPVHLAYCKRFQRGDVLGPRMITTSPGLDDLGANGTTAWNGGRCVRDPATARPLVLDFARRGYSQIKVYSSLTPAVLHAVGTAAAEVGLRMVGHCPKALTFEDAMAAGQSCFEHLLNIEMGRRLVGGGPWSLDLGSVRRLAAHMAALDVWNCPTQVVLQQSPEDREVVAARDAMLTDVVRILYHEGAPLLAGSDAPNHGLVPGASLHDELENLEHATGSPFAALRGATVDAARFVGENDWGVVAVGKRADLVLVSSNPLSGVRALRDIEAVVNAGRLLRRDELEAIRATLGRPPREAACDRATQADNGQLDHVEYGRQAKSMVVESR